MTKQQETLIQQHSVTSQTAWLFISSTVETSNLINLELFSHQLKIKTMVGKKALMNIGNLSWRHNVSTGNILYSEE